MNLYFLSIGLLSSQASKVVCLKQWIHNPCHGANIHDMETPYEMQEPWVYKYDWWVNLLIRHTQLTLTLSSSTVNTWYLVADMHQTWKPACVSFDHIKTLVVLHENSTASLQLNQFSTTSVHQRPLYQLMLRAWKHGPLIQHHSRTGNSSPRIPKPKIQDASMGLRTYLVNFRFSYRKKETGLRRHRKRCTAKKGNRYFHIRGWRKFMGIVY